MALSWALLVLYYAPIGSHSAPSELPAALSGFVLIYAVVILRREVRAIAKNTDDRVVEQYVGWLLVFAIAPSGVLVFGFGSFPREAVELLVGVVYCIIGYTLLWLTIRDWSRYNKHPAKLRLITLGATVLVYACAEAYFAYWVLAVASPGASMSSGFKILFAVLKVWFSGVAIWSIARCMHPAGRRPSILMFGSNLLIGVPSVDAVWDAATGKVPSSDVPEFGMESAPN